MSKVVVNSIDDKNKDTTQIIIDELKVFREALYNNNWESLKEFFDFPIVDSAQFGNFFHKDHPIYNFTESTSEIVFKKLYKEVFPKPFIKSFLKLKMNILFKEKYFETEMIETSVLELNKVICSIEESVVYLIFQTNHLIIENKQKELVGESTCKYVFKLNQNNKLKFKKLDLAG